MSRAAAGQRYAAALAELFAAWVDLEAHDRLANCKTGFASQVDIDLLKHGVFAMARVDNGKSFDKHVEEAMAAIQAAA